MKKFGALSKSFFPDYEMPDRPTTVDRNIQKVIDADNQVVRMTRPMMNEMVERYMVRKDALDICRITHRILNTPQKNTLWMMTSPNIEHLYHKQARFADSVGEDKVFHFEEEEVRVYVNQLGTTPKSITLGIFYYLSTISATVAGEYDLEVQLTRDVLDVGDIVEDLFPAKVVLGSDENIIIIRGNNIRSRPLRTSNIYLEKMLIPDFNITVLPENNDLVSDAVAIIKANITNPEFSLADLADVMCVSPRTLQRRLKQKKTSFIELKNAERAELVMKYLAKGETKEQIIQLVGYKDIGSIHKLLTRHDQK